MDIKTQFGTSLDNIWNGYSQSCAGTKLDTTLEPAIVGTINTPCDVLFIGMNPSHPVKDTRGNTVSQNNYYCPTSMTIPYFKGLVDLCSNMALSSWGYLDLYPIRHTNQKDIIDIRKSKQAKSFFEQLEQLTQEIIKRVSPKLIVVINAGAGKVLREIYGIKSFPSNTYDWGRGVEMVEIDGGVLKPVIFSGMLTGQRALDIGSRVSLQWHIAKVISLKTPLKI